MQLLMDKNGHTTVCKGSGYMKGHSVSARTDSLVIDFSGFVNTPAGQGGQSLTMGRR